MYLNKLLCCLILLLGMPGVLGTAEASKPNIIFVMADDLGYGDLGCYGQERIRTPNLDRLAAEGMRFTNFYAGSTVCAPSRCVLMTGYHTGHCYIRGNGKDNLRPSDITVGEVLQQAGYHTGLIGKWGLGHEGSTGVPTKQGFDYFYGYLDQHHAHNYYPEFLIRNEERVPLNNEVPDNSRWKYDSGVASKKVDYSHDLMVQETIEFIKRNQDQPFFLYLALTIPHANNEGGKQGMEVPDLEPYADEDWPEQDKATAAMITRMDRDLGKIVALLKKLGIDENTVIFFTSDNGPHAEGGHDPDFFDSNGPLTGVKRDLTEGGIRVPMIARWPDHIKAGATSDFIGSFQDVMPTLAAIAGDASQVPKDIDGLSFAPTLLGDNEEQVQHDALYWAFYEQGGARALRMGDWKAIQQPYDAPVRLYNLGDDLAEQNNLASEKPDVLRKMIKIMDQSYAPSERWRFPRANSRR